MKFKMVVEDLKRSLGQLAKAVPKNPSILAIGNVRISVKDSLAKMTCTDLSVEKSVIVECESKDEFVIAIPFFKFFSLIKTYADDKSITLTLKPDHAVLVCGKSRNKMPIFSADGFPSVEIGDKTLIGANPIDVSEAIGMVSYAAGRNEVMAQVNTVSLHRSEKGLDVVATNKALMAVKNVECDSDFDQVLIPIKVASFAKEDMLEANTIETDKRSLIISGDDFVTVINLMNAKYPNYKAAIPKDEVRHEITFSKENMLECLNRVIIIADDPLKSRCIITAPKDSTEAIIQGRFLAGDSSEIDEHLPIENNSEEDMVIAYNPFFLSQSIEKVDCETLTCNVYDNRTQSLVVSGDGFTGVVTKVII